MNIFCQPFETDEITNSEAARKIALNYANKIQEIDEENQVFNISESADDYGYYITVWYKAKEKVKV